MVEHYFDKKQTSNIITTPVTFSFAGKKLRFDCVSGTFSSKAIDFATSLLLHHAKLQDGWDVLDCGCGIGVLGICIKKAYPQCTVVLTDVNERALAFAQKNAAKNAVDVEIITSDLFAELKNKKFDTILSNPPHHAGRAVVFRLIEESLYHLKPKGLLQVVAQHNRGGKMIEKKMKGVFGNCESVIKKGGWRVYSSHIIVVT